MGKGKQRGLLERLIKEHGLRKKVRILPPHTQEEIVQRFHEAHVLALPCIVGKDGNRDGLPVSIVEAQACGLAVISTAVTGVPEAVHDGENGFIVPENDAVAVADKLELLLTDRAELARLRAAARPTAQALFDENLTSRHLHQLFRETVKTVLPGFSPEEVADVQREVSR